MMTADPPAYRASWWRSIRLAFDRQRFLALRADYYDYLACLLGGMQGRRSLKDVFEMDARRYGPSSVRGRLSAYWALAYQAAGGDLHATWQGSVPDSELALVRSAQAFGNTALIRTLDELAAAVRLTQQARGILVSTLWTAGFAMFSLLSMVLAVPWFTAPRLQQVFSGLPRDYHGPLARALWRFADQVHAHAPLAIVLAAAAVYLVLWSLPNAVGSLRRMLDRHGVWRLYRHLCALRFLGLLAILLRKDAGGAVQWRAALAAQGGGATPWMASHIQRMLARVDGGMAGAQALDTGLLDRELFWFFCDMVMARGLPAGLALSVQRLRNQILGEVARQAMALRWGMLLGCLASLMALCVWHYAVIDELRRSLMLFYAGQ